MKRLTHERVNGIKKGNWSPNKKQELIDKLAEYENTGLTPEEIISLNEFENSNSQKYLLEIAKHRWIPCGERMPENPEELVLVQVSGNSCENIRFENAIELARYNCEEGWIVEHYPEWDDVFPVAWMYLPDPYHSEDKCHGCFGASENSCGECADDSIRVLRKEEGYEEWRGLSGSDARQGNKPSATHTGENLGADQVG